MQFQSLTDGHTLENGVRIPCIGFGTWQTPDGETAVTAVKAALAAGYRHIDTAAAYENEQSIGRAVHESGVAREDIFITTKLANPDHGYDNTMAAFDRSMQKLGLTYLDLYLIHWPNPLKYRDAWQEANAGTWKAFETLYGEKRIRAIGISNFMQRHIEALMRTASIAPMVNQIRLCPGDTQDALVAYCRGMGMVLEAYSPMGIGRAFETPAIVAIAEKYGRSVAQVCIRWSLQMGFLPLPKSVTPSRIAENTRVFDFALEDADVQALAGMTGVLGTHRNPDEAPF